ncbi:MAG: TonB-dependent receptor [Bacteroidetes bacterium]|nr:TonB-dependent receptor [Bacteroidota bacterium]MBU1678816.1 TonB-dependent receptor [Bacteroidota bacterium]MBU2506065.1 TonB-dependent receptor [Bacteroidota bacterium]
MNILNKSLFAILIFSSIISAQKYSVSGKITDTKNLPQLGANVLVKGTLIGTSSDEKGNFVLKGLVKGQHELIVSMLGYKRSIVPIVIKDKNISELNISLEPTIYLYDQVVVTAGKYQQEIKTLPVSVQIVDADNISKKGFQQLDEVLRNVPGVSMTLDQISIRGSSGYSRGAGTRILVAFDGIPLYSGDSGEIIWNLVPLMDIDRVEVIKGAASSLYGSTALGGVINLISKKNSSSSVTLLHSEAGIYSSPSYEEWDWSKSSRTFYNTTLSHSGNYEGLGVSATVTKFNDMGYRQNDWENRYSAYLKTDYAFNESNSASIFVTGFTRTKGTFNYWKDIANVLVPPDADQGEEIPSTRFIFGGAYNYLFSKNVSLSFKPSLYTTNWEDESESANKSNSKLFRSEALMNYKISDEIILASGVEVQTGIVSSNIFGNHTSNGFAVFSQMEYVFTPLLRLTGGIRYDYFDIDSLSVENSISPKVGINYQLSSASILRASAGKGFRSPTLAEAYTSTTTSGVMVKPNPNIKSETCYSFEIGFNHSFGPSFVMDAAVFQNEYYDMIEPKIDPADSKVIFENVTRARIQGFDWTLMLALLDDKLNITSGYTYLNPKDLNLNRELRYRSNHQLNFVANYDLSPVEFGCDIRYLSRVKEIDYELVSLGIVKNGDERVDIFVLDFRAGLNLFAFNFPGRINFNIKNALNYNYIEMIGNLAPIRSFVLGADIFL